MKLYKVLINENKCYVYFYNKQEYNVIKGNTMEWDVLNHVDMLFVIQSLIMKGFVSRP